MWIGSPEVSKAVIVRTPLVRLLRLDQNASRPMPIGLTTPRPVTTTLRGDWLERLVGIRVGNREWGYKRIARRRWGLDNHQAANFRLSHAAQKGQAPTLESKL